MHGTASQSMRGEVMPDIVLTSSVFGEVKIAEPVGICYLGAIARQHGYSVEFLEPSLAGWSSEQTAEIVLRRPSALLGVSMLRDEQKTDVLAFLSTLRRAGDDRFIVVGGHAPSVAIMTGVEDIVPPYEGRSRSSARGDCLGVQQGLSGCAAHPDSARQGCYYADLARYCNAFMLGECDLSFPMVVDAVLGKKPWRHLPGVAYMGPEGSFVINPPGAKTRDLDALPFMARDTLESYLERFPGSVAAAVCFGRGCHYACTFCTVAAFQALQSGPRHRQRSAGNVVEEIRQLHDRYGISVFNFEDDNFIVRSRSGVAKIRQLCAAIRELPFDITFSIFCRADAVEEGLFQGLKRAGLKTIYLGVFDILKGNQSAGF